MIGWYALVLVAVAAATAGAKAQDRDPPRMVFDGTGLTVYPGFVDSMSNLGIAARPTPTPGGPGGGGILLGHVVDAHPRMPRSEYAGGRVKIL